MVRTTFPGFLFIPLVVGVFVLALLVRMLGYLGCSRRVFPG